MPKWCGPLYLETNRSTFGRSQIWHSMIASASGKKCYLLFAQSMMLDMFLYGVRSCFCTEIVAIWGCRLNSSLILVSFMGEKAFTVSFYMSDPDGWISSCSLFSLFTALKRGWPNSYAIGNSSRISKIKQGSSKEILVKAIRTTLSFAYWEEKPCPLLVLH